VRSSNNISRVFLFLVVAKYKALRDFVFIRRFLIQLASEERSLNVCFFFFNLVTYITVDHMILMTVIQGMPIVALVFSFKNHGVVFDDIFLQLAPVALFYAVHLS
jgi:hypothetical protein